MVAIGLETNEDGEEGKDGEAEEDEERTDNASSRSLAEGDDRGREDVEEDGAKSGDSFPR